MISIISVTEKGDYIAEKLSKKFQVTLYCKSKISNFNLSVITKEAIEKYNFIIFVSSTGIAVRAVAPYLKSKDKDPGIIVVDVGNNFTISLVSGHIGGANEFTLKISEILGNKPIITTATDNMGILAPDMIAKKNNLIIEDLKKAKYIAALLVNNKKVYFKDDFNSISVPVGYLHKDIIKKDAVWITNKIFSENIEDDKKVLKLIKKNIVLGIGCKKNTESKKLKDFILLVLKENNIDFRAVKKIGSIDIKKEEQCIIDLSNYLQCEFEVFSKDRIKTLEHKFEQSPFVHKTLGVGCVCEPVVELLNGNIIISKIKKEGMTLCVGQIL